LTPFYIVVYRSQSNMESKIHLIATMSILAFALIAAAGVPAAAFVSVLAQGEGGGTGGLPGGEGMTGGGGMGADTNGIPGEGEMTGGEGGITGGGNTTDGMTGGEGEATGEGMAEDQPYE
jgi:hypothetical protein